MRAGGTTSTVEVAAVAESVAEAGPLEITQNSATPVIEVAESGGEGEAGSHWSRADSTTSIAEVTAVAKSVGEAGSSRNRRAECHDET